MDRVIKFLQKLDASVLINADESCVLKCGENVCPSVSNYNAFMTAVDLVIDERLMFTGPFGGGRSYLRADLRCIVKSALVLVHTEKMDIEEATDSILRRIADLLCNEPEPEPEPEPERKTTMDKILDREAELKIALNQLLTSINNVVDSTEKLVADKSGEYRVSYTTSLFELSGELVLLKPKILNQLTQL